MGRGKKDFRSKPHQSKRRSQAEESRSSAHKTDGLSEGCETLEQDEEAAASAKGSASESAVESASANAPTEKDCGENKPEASPLPQKPEQLEMDVATVAKRSKVKNENKTPVSVVIASQESLEQKPHNVLDENDLKNWTTEDMPTEKKEQKEQEQRATDTDANQTKITKSTAAKMSLKVDKAYANIQRRFDHLVSILKYKINRDDEEEFQIQDLEDEIPNVKLSEIDEKKKAGFVSWLRDETEHCIRVILASRGELPTRNGAVLELSKCDDVAYHSAIIDMEMSVEKARSHLKKVAKVVSILMEWLGNEVAATNEIFLELIDWLVVEEKWEGMERINIKDRVPVVPKSVLDTGVKNCVVTDTDLYLLRYGLPGYKDALQRLVNKTTGLQWSLNVINDLQGASQLLCDYDQIKGMVNKLPDAARITDIRVGKMYSSLFKSAFSNLSFNDKKQMMTYFFDQHRVQTFHNLDDTYVDTLQAFINKLAQYSKREVIRKMAIDLSWHFMISVRQTWYRLLQACLNTPAIIPTVVEILRFLTPLIDIRTTNDERLLFAGVQRLVTQGELKTEALERNWIRIVCALVTPTTRPALLDVNEAIQTLVLPLTDKRLALRALLALLESSNAAIKWSVSIPDKNAGGEINAAGLLAELVHNLITGKKPSDKLDKGLEVPLKILKQLAECWKSKEVKFPPKTVEWLRDRFSASDWEYRSLALAVLIELAEEKQRILVPRCCLEILELPSADFEAVDCDEWSEQHAKTRCAFRALFSLARLSVDAANRVLLAANLGFVTPACNGADIRAEIRTALTDILSKCSSTGDWNRCSVFLGLLFDRLADEFGKSSASRIIPSQDFTRGLLVVAPCSVICEAVSSMVAKNGSSASEAVRNFTAIAYDTVKQRIEYITNSLTKHASLNTLLMDCLALSSLLKKSPLELNTLIFNLINSLEHEQIVTNRPWLKELVKSANIEIGTALMQEWTS